MNRLAHILHKGIIALVTNLGFYAFTAFVVSSLFSMDPFLFTRDGVMYFQRNVLVPWGLALCLMRVERLVSQGGAKLSADVLTLMLLCGWVSVPFAVRFGWAQNNWQSYLIAFLGVYAAVSEADADARERHLNTMTGLFAVLGWVLGVTLMYCLATVTVFTVPEGNFGYGIFQNKYLISGHYYNTTGIIALGAALMCLCGACRARKAITRALYIAPFVMMTVVVVLTQSRTSRYALLAALALCAYGAVQEALGSKKMLLRHAAAVCAAAVVLAGGYIAADKLTDAALSHVQRVSTQHAQTAFHRAFPAALAQDEAQEEQQAAQETEKPVPASTENLKRNAGDLSFTGRTTLWGNIFRFWKENPKYMFIGYGPGRTGPIIGAGTEFSKLGGAQAHNAYLQFAMEYGMIGMALLAVFAVLMLRPVIRVFFCAKWREGYGVLVALAAAVLLIGLMESDPLSAMSISNVLLFFSLAQAAGKGRSMN